MTQNKNEKCEKNEKYFSFLFFVLCILTPYSYRYINIVCALSTADIRSKPVGHFCVWKSFKASKTCPRSLDSCCCFNTAAQLGYGVKGQHVFSPEKNNIAYCNEQCQHPIISHFLQLGKEKKNYNTEREKQKPLTSDLWPLASSFQIFLSQLLTFEKWSTSVFCSWPPNKWMNPINFLLWNVPEDDLWFSHSSRGYVLK